MNIGFIGFGNMAQAIVNGMVNKANIDPSLIHVCSAHFDFCQKNAEKYGVCAHASSLEVVGNAELIVLAVKPYQIEEVVEPIRKTLASKIVISIAAGCFYDFYEEILEPQTQHISAIPNTPIAVGKGILVTEQKHSLQPESLESFVQQLRRLNGWKLSSYPLRPRLPVVHRLIQPCIWRLWPMPESNMV